MALCTNSRCTAPPPRDSQRIVHTGPAARGELFMACAAMKHPFLERVKNSGITILTYQSTALGSQYTQGPWRNGVKPCIVAAGATKKAGAKIYLIRLFTPDRIADLPAIMRHYLIPIHDIHNDQSWLKQSGTHHEHLHTSPSWAEGANHWVLGLACEAEDGAMGNRCQRRSTNSPADGSHYFIDHATMEKFTSLCIARDNEWSGKPREEKENGLVQLSEWNAPKRKMREFNRRAKSAKGTALDLPVVAAEMKNLQLKKGFGDAASIKSKASSMPSGAVRLRKFFERHVVGGKWGWAN